MSTEKIFKQKGFSINLEGSYEKSTLLSDGYYGLLDWQQSAFERLHDANCMILNAPMGSGKSWLMCALSASKLLKDKKLRCILAVPQTIIAPGFLEAKFQLPDGAKIDWSVAHNLCDERSNTKTVSYLFNWLKEDHSANLSSRVIICTHSTLVALNNKLKVHNCAHLLDNLLLWIDEAHHIRNVAVGELPNAVISNSIGEIVASLLNNKFNNVHLGLTTASFFRGDRCSLLTEQMEQMFTRFNLPYDEYLKSMKHLKSFSYDFLICGPDYTKAIQEVVQERKGKDIIYVPHPVSRFSTGSKYREVNHIVEKYENLHGKSENHGAILNLYKDGQEFKILDLVSENGRIHKKGFINSKQLNSDRDSLDAIISLGMFKEGANWIWADRSIIVGSRASLVDVIQMIGRLFRDAEGKEHVETIHLLPFSFDQGDEDAFRENLNNYLKAIFSLLILENILKPIKIKTPLINSNGQTTAHEKKSENWLDEMVPDYAKQVELLEEATKQLSQVICEKNEIVNDIDKLRNKYKEIMPSILEDNGIHEHQEEISEELWNILSRRTLTNQGIAIENIDFDLLQSTNPLNGLLRYTSEVCNTDTFQKLRDAIQLNRAPLSLNLIINWLQQYISKYNKKPHMQSGKIEFATGPYDGITWSAVNACLWKGGRGLPGGSSLANLVEQEFGMRNRANLPVLTEGKIYEWVDQFIKKYNRKPDRQEGAIEFATGRHKGETWGSIDSCLLEGLRGLPGGSSLAKFIEQNFGIRGYCNPPKLSLSQIRSWIAQYIKKHKKKPTAKSGLVEFAEGEYKDISWATISHAMRNGTRGLEKGASLAEFIKNEFNISNHYTVTPLTEKIIVDWITKFIDKYDRKPTQNDGEIEFAHNDYNGLTWFTLNSCLWKGGRGFAGGSSLAKFIKTHFGLKNHNYPPELNVELINQWISQYIKKYRKKPSKTSGEIEFAEGEYYGITWGAVDCAFKAGKRELPKITLAQHVQNEFKIRSAGNVAILSEELIIEWIKKYLDQYGYYPKAKSKTVPYAAGEHIGITWLAIDAALRRGTHGLSGGSSLSRFIAKKFNITEVYYNLPNEQK